jgi:hypothetical protein
MVRVWTILYDPAANSRPGCSTNRPPASEGNAEGGFPPTLRATQWRPEDMGMEQ